MRVGSFAAADHPALRASPMRHGRDKDVGVADQSSLDPLSVLVVQEPFPPVTRNVLGEKNDDDIVRILLRSILEEPDERLDERSEWLLHDHQRDPGELTLESRPDPI